MQFIANQSFVIFNSGFLIIIYQSGEKKTKLLIKWIWLSRTISNIFLFL